MTTISIQQAIDQYNSEGLSFFPIPARSKEAAIPWKVYQERQPTQAEIAQWKSNGTANLAIVCGSVSGNLVVVDFDSLDRFHDYLYLLNNSYNIDLFTHTRIVRTSKGVHVYFRLPNTLKSAKFPQIDIKAEGGYVIAPPSIHQSGKVYECCNPDIPIRQITSLAEVGIDLTQKLKGGQAPLRRAGEIIPPGTQDQWLYSRACGYRVRGDDVDTVIEKLRIDIKRCPQEPGKRPYDDADFKRIAESACKRSPGFPPNGNNTHIINPPHNTTNDSKIVQNRDNSVTDSSQNTDNGKKINYSSSFDQVLKDAGHLSRRDIFLSIGLQHTSDLARQIVKRRLESGQVRFYRGSGEILEWVNREYKVLSLADYRAKANLAINLPLDLNKHVKVPAGSVIGVAGYTSACKTGFLLETCELNINQDKPVYYWFNEMSEDRMLLRLEDYPSLVGEMGKIFKAIKQTDFEFYDVIDPDGINVIDYLDMDGQGDQAVYMIGSVIKKLQRRLEKGIVIFALQKQKVSDMGYGGIYSSKLSNLYLSLDTVSQGEKAMFGKCKIVKAKDWTETNPVGLYCNYYTGGKHGKIMSDNVWRRDNS